jgi:hypothetical protein
MHRRRHNLAILASVLVMGAILWTSPEARAQESTTAPSSSIEEVAVEDAGATKTRASQRPKLDRKRRREGQYMVDEKGRRFRVSFPLYDRLSIEGNTGFSPIGEGRNPAQVGGRLRSDLSVSLDFSEDEVWWMMRHKLLDTSLARTGGAEPFRVQGTVLEARYLRHDLSTFIVVPAANDFRLPGNFDIALDYTLGRYDFTFGGGTLNSQRIDVVDLSFLMDFIRDETYRHRFAVGMASWYHATPGDLWQHEISPLTAGKVLYGWDHKDGLFRFYTEAICGASLTVDTEAVDAPMDWGWRCRSLLEMEWTPIAISDAPLSIPLEVRADFPFENRDAFDVRATLGIRWSLNLD